MKYKLCWERGGSVDSIIVEGESIEEIREKAKEEIKKRGISENNCWSEEVKNEI
jgi:CRISPR/Cas system-associated protein Cas10 (large subunit of type III CRISPR-Cas system)